MRTDDTKFKRSIDPERLAQLIETADRVIVKESTLTDSKIVFESKEKADLEALKQSITIESPKEWFHCMCIGGETIHLYSGDEEVVQITNHHGDSIRCSRWDSDVKIIDTERWLSWFDERGIDGPRKEVEEMRKLEAQWQKDYNRWTSAMPEGLRLVWEDSLGQMDDVNTASLRDALKKSIPDKNEQIRALLTWYGSGAGPWNGYPSYESAAEELLLDYNIAEIVDAIEINKLTHEQTEGAARFFGEWSPSKKRRSGIKNIPVNLKRVFWNHVKNTKDAYKLGRAKRVFK